MKTTSKTNLSGYQPRHIANKETDFCENKCVIVDGIKVPFPDCGTHGNPFTTNQKCGTIEVCP